TAEGGQNAQIRGVAMPGGGTPPASISRVTPPSGAPGEDVTLTGRGFGTSGTIAFDRTAATTKNWADTSIVATVPAVGSGPISVPVTPAAGGTAGTGWRASPPNQK